MATFKYRVSICAMYKNEAIYLPEWLELHIAGGFDHFYLYNNRSDDDHQQILAPYIERGLVTYHDYNLDFSSLHPSIPWRSADYPYNHCIHHYAHESQWIGFFDIDEFVTLREHKSIVDFMCNYERYAGIAMNWMCLSSSGHYFEPTGLVIENYTLRFPRSYSVNSHVKSIINPRLWIEWGNPHLPYVKGHI